MTTKRSTGAVLGLLILFSAASLARESGRTPVAITPHFAFYSDFETNLHDALLNAGVALRFHKPQLFHDGDEADCFGKLPSAQQAAWEHAVDYYAKAVAPTSTVSWQRYLLRAQLAGL